MLRMGFMAGEDQSDAPPDQHGRTQSPRRAGGFFYDVGMVRPQKSNLTPEQKEKLLADLRRDVTRRQKGYRERALALYPHVCASCGRAFEGVRLKELTVHHKDHNHDNNPPDGSNWELLCLYCHDHEHEKHADGRADRWFGLGRQNRPLHLLALRESGSAAEDERSQSVIRPAAESGPNLARARQGRRSVAVRSKVW
jgi:hypothetical protein